MSRQAWRVVHSTHPPTHPPTYGLTDWLTFRDMPKVPPAHRGTLEAEGVRCARRGRAEDLRALEVGEGGGAHLRELVHQPRLGDRLSSGGHVGSHVLGTRGWLQQP